MKTALVVAAILAAGTGPMRGQAQMEEKAKLEVEIRGEGRAEVYGKESVGQNADGVCD